MATLADIVARIADDLARSDLDMQIAVAVNRAITHYAGKTFWFNEGSGTFTTVAATQTYTTSSTSPLPSYIKEINQLRLNNGSGSLLTLTRRSLKWLLETNVSGTTTQGEPTDYCWYDDTLYLYPTPDDAYAVTVYYTKGYATLTLADSNDFTTAAEDLIEARATWWVAARLLKDYERAQFSKVEEMEALASLIERSERLIATGQLARSYL